MFAFLDAVEVILYKCITQVRDDKGEVTAIEICFKYLDDFKDPAEGGIYELYRRLRGSSTAVTPSDDTYTEMEEVDYVHTMANTRSIATPVKFSRSNHVLNWMVSFTIITCQKNFCLLQVKYERTNLLQHLVTQELISYKWRTFARPAFVLNLVLYSVFLVFLTSFALTLPLPTDILCDEKICKGQIT